MYIHAGERVQRVFVAPWAESRGFREGTKEALINSEM
jgi:hypothetical protein